MLITEGVLCLDHLQTLFSGRQETLVVKGYYTQEHCRILADKIRNSIGERTESGSAIYETDTLPFYNAVLNQSNYHEYFKNSVAYMRHVRNLSAPFLAPVDKLRLELDEIWPHGARVMDIHGQKMTFGIARMWNSRSEGLPHQDVLHRELPGDKKAGRIARQLGVNIYLTTPTEGGELEIWDRIIDDDEWKRLNVVGSYGYSRENLPNKSILIKPEAGDLALIDTSHVHAIRPVISGDRITISGFLAYFDGSQPLELWS